MSDKIFQILTNIVDWKATITFVIIIKIIVEKKTVFKIKLIHVKIY